MLPHKLEKMLLQFSAKAVLSIEKVVYAAEGASFKTRIPDAGVATFSQIAGCDCAYVRLKGNRKSRNGMDVLYGCNPDIQVYTSWNRFVRALFRFEDEASALVPDASDCGHVVYGSFFHAK